jgi:hypothetical protein
MRAWKARGGAGQLSLSPATDAGLEGPNRIRAMDFGLATMPIRKWRWGR